MYAHLSGAFFTHFSLILYATFHSSRIRLCLPGTRSAFKILIYMLLPPLILRVMYFTQLSFVNHLQHSHYSLDLCPCTCKLESCCFTASTVLKGNKINQINKWQRNKKTDDLSWLFSPGSYKQYVQQLQAACAPMYNGPLSTFTSHVMH